MFTPAIQIIEECDTEQEAVVLNLALAIQAGMLANRILEPCNQPGREKYRVQAIMETNGEFPNGWLPDGMRHVIWRGYF